MTESEEIKYLGEIITNSLEESIHKTAMKRIGIAKQAVYEIRAVIEDKRSRTIGGMNLAFEIFNASVVSMVIHNSETWCSIPKKTHKVLNDLFLLFFRAIFRIGVGTPVVSFYWETAILKPKFQILQRTLLFIHHLANLPASALSHQIFQIQVNHEIPGLISKNKEHLEILNFEATKNMSKWQFRKLVNMWLD